MTLQQECIIVYKDKPNDHAVRFTLSADELVERSFKAPGQFVHIKCGHSRLLRRPISVCSCKSEAEGPDLLTIVFEVRGSGTEWLERREVGDPLDILGMLGNGFSMESQGRYLLVGGGIGVPPLLGCAQYGENATAVLGFRDSSHVLLAGEFENCCKDVFLCTDDGSLGRKGFVHEQVRDILEKDSSYTGVLACGPKPMLKAVAQTAAHFGVPCQVSLEERMACGVGACLGCAVKMADGSMKHVCKDGPIFDASEVDWNG